jgi:Domain of unknown function (DUF4340)
MNFRLTLALVIVMLATLIVYVGVKSHQQNEKPEDPLTKNALLTPQPTAINTFTFTQDGAKQVAFSRNGSDWSLTFPVVAAAENYSVSSIADSLKTLTYKDKFDPEATGVHSPDNTGTDKPHNIVTFTDDANKEHTLALGKTTVGGVYATLDGGKTIYLLATNPAEKLDQDPMTFRNKTLKETPAEKITGLTIKHTDQTVSLAKTGDKWMIDAPVAARANATAVEDILGEMKNIRASQFSDFAKDMPATGLQHPLVTVTALVEDQPSTPATTAASQPAAVKTPVTLELGYYTDLTDKKNVYASLGGSAEVFTVSSDTFNKLNRELKDLRDPAITPAPVADATAISIHHLDAAATDLVKQDGKWTLTGPAIPPLPGDPTAVNDLLSNIRDLRAIKFVDNAGDLQSIGLDPPQTRIELTLPAQSQHEVILLGKPQNAEAVTPVMRQGEPTVYLVQTPEINKLALAPLGLRDRTVAKLEANDIRTIAITGPNAANGGITLERDGTTWKATKDGKPVNIDDSKVQTLLADFTPLTAASYVAAGETISGKPDVTVTLTTNESTAPTTAPATGPATRPAAVGPNPTRTVTRVLRLYNVTGWRALLDGGIAPEWTFEPNATLVEHVTTTSYLAPATQPAK